VPRAALAALIRQQGVKPVTDLAALGALWPDNDDPAALERFIRDERAARRSSRPRRKTA
jgi:hypothetical protein